MAAAPAEPQSQPDSGPSATLLDLPTSVLHHVFDLINDEGTRSSAGGAGGGGAGGGAAAAAVGSPRDIVHLAFSCKAMLEAVAAAEQMWQCQCRRLGWSLAWLAALPPGTSAWVYFCRRMAVRHRLRRLLRTLSRFLDPLSAAAIRPAAPAAELAEVEAALQAPLPWELFELYRHCDGQDRERGAIQFLHEARLLSLREMLAAAQERQGPATLARAFAALVTHAPAQPGPSAGVAGGSHGAGTGRGGCGMTASSSCAAGSSDHAPLAAGSGTHDWAGSSTAATEALPEPPAEPDVLLPFSDELRGRRRYCMDLQGRVWLASGWHAHPCAPSLAALLRRILT
ncbi:hypothetical protein ABPG75_011898 [Micractinium tetrahymenae]